MLADVELTVVHGERVGFVGANGAGKSVLLKTVVGELEPTEGEVWVGPSIRDRLPRAGPGDARPGVQPARDGAARPPLLGGRGGRRC